MNALEMLEWGVFVLFSLSSGLIVLNLVPLSETLGAIDNAILQLPLAVGIGAIVGELISDYVDLEWEPVQLASFSALSGLWVA